MPLFGQLNYGALYPARRAFGLDQFLPADEEMARRGYPLYGSNSGSGSGGGGSPPAAEYKPPNDGSGGGNGDLMRQRDQWPAGGGYGLPMGPGKYAGAGGPMPFPTLGLQTTRRTQLFGPLANLPAPRLF
jgi:hypothetical protein